MLYKDSIVDIAHYLTTLEERLEKLENEDNCDICGIFTPTPTEKTEVPTFCATCKAYKGLQTPTEVKDWEVSFDKEFPSTYSYGDTGLQFETDLSRYKEKIKLFIRNLLNK